MVTLSTPIWNLCHVCVFLLFLPPSRLTWGLFNARIVSNRVRLHSYALRWNVKVQSHPQKRSWRQVVLKFWCKVRTSQVWKQHLMLGNSSWFAVSFGKIQLRRSADTLRNMRLFHWDSLLQPFWTFDLQAIQPKSKKRNLGKNSYRFLTEKNTTKNVKMDGGYESSVWYVASLAHLRAGNRSKSGKPRYNAEGVTWPKLSRGPTSSVQWRFAITRDQRIRNFRPEVEQIQKFGENYANQLKKILGTKTRNSQQLWNLFLHERQSCNFQRLSLPFIFTKPFACAKRLQLQLLPVAVVFLVPGWVVYTFCWSSAIASHRNMLGRSNFETSSFTLS